MYFHIAEGHLSFDPFELRLDLSGASSILG